MTTIEIAELINSVDMYEVAHKTENKMALDESEEAVVAQLDQHFKEVGRRGVDAESEIAAFVQKVINTEIYNTPDELLDVLFDQGTIGEFDDYEMITEPKNTLIAYEAARGGNVERTFLDVTKITPTWCSRQIESEISYADLERNGWKTVAKITDFAIAAFKNTMFADIFNAIDAAIVSGAENYLSVAAAMPTSAAADAIALYVQDRTDGANEGLMVGRSKYIQAMSKFTGFTSDEIINEVHRTGRLGVYDGVSMVPISSAKKLGDGSGLILDKRIFGIAGKIGTLNMKGEIKVYEDMDSTKEKITLKFKNFTYGYAFNNAAIDKVFKVVLQ